MRIEPTVDGLRIIADTEIERAYVRDTLGLKEPGDHIDLVREDSPDAQVILTAKK